MVAITVYYIIIFTLLLLLILIAGPSSITWTSEPCMFFKEGDVMLSWKLPLIGANCCTEYELFNEDLNMIVKKTNKTTAYVPLNNMSYTVRCKDDEQNSSTSIPLRIQPS